MSDERLTLTIAEASGLLGISRAHAYGLARVGELPSIKLGKRVVVPRRALEQFIESAANRRASWNTRFAKRTVSMSDAPWQLEFYEDENGRAPCREWMKRDLDELERAALAVAFTHVLQVRGLGVCGTEWGKQLGGGLFEFRIRHSAAEIASMFGGDERATGHKGKVLLRVFCHAYGNRIVLLLSGYDKGDDPAEKRQAKEIKRARKLLNEFQGRKRRRK